MTLLPVVVLASWYRNVLQCSSQHDGLLLTRGQLQAYVASYAECRGRSQLRKCNLILVLCTRHAVAGVVACRRPMNEVSFQNKQKLVKPGACCATRGQKSMPRTPAEGCSKKWE